MSKVRSRTVGDCFKAACPAREIVNHVSSRWGGLILAALLERDLRYSEIRSRIGGISEKMLAQMLDVLERDGLISRMSRPVVPPHVEYALTSSGRDLAQRFMDLFRWIGENVQTFVAAQKAFDSRKAQP
ncbi:MAG TPA: helix-turn-helix domain-containing protein [Candidatus Acidoferrales bacterium]|nr:helix-turn-helix domain-containing protein [Candidatus Acidoferrales bacterium]